MKLSTLLTKLPKLFSNSVFNFAWKSSHVNSVSETWPDQKLLNQQADLAKADSYVSVAIELTSGLLVIR